MQRTLSPARLSALALAAVCAAAVYFLGLGAPTFAQTPFGGATEQDNFIALTSNTGNASTADDFSGVSFGVASGTTLSELGPLTARYNVVTGDCGGGSPRFQINVTNGTTTGNIFAYLGPEPNYTGCQLNTWVDSADALGGTRLIDTSQLPGGTFYDTWADAEADFGTWEVTGVQLVVDAGWATGGLQRVRVTDVTLGTDSYTFPAAAPVMLEAPTNVSPANGATLTSAEWSMADWSDVAASSTPVSYYYESSLSSSTNPDGSFSSPIFQSGALSSSEISTAGTGEGTYFWHARAQDSLGNMSPWSSTVMVMVDNSATSTPPNDDAQALIDELMDLQDQYPDFFWQLQWLIDDLEDDNGGGTPPPPTGDASIDNNGSTIPTNGHLDFVGRNFGSDELVTMSLNGSTLRTIRADGGGNFSTGAMTGPSSPGTYTYVFTGQTSGETANSVITVQ